MSGKGSAVFGIFNNINIAKKALSIMKKDYPKTFLVKPVESVIASPKGVAIS